MIGGLALALKVKLTKSFPMVVEGANKLPNAWAHCRNPPIIRYPFDTQYADANLNLNKIYILTGSQTASASEAVINGLIPYMGAENVILIGTKTEGKNVAMSSFKNETHGLTLWPVIAYVSNANNEGEYSEGFEPTYKYSSGFPNGYHWLMVFSSNL